MITNSLDSLRGMKVEPAVEVVGRYQDSKPKIYFISYHPEFDGDTTLASKACGARDTVFPMKCQRQTERKPLSDPIYPILLQPPLNAVTLERRSE